MSTATLVLLRLIHIVLGLFWVGAVLVLTWFILPSLRAVGPAGGALMQQLAQVRRLPMWMMAASVLTLLSGVGLYWHGSSGFGSAAWLGSGPGRTFGLGGALAIAAAIVGMAVNNPAGRKLGALVAKMQAAGRPPSPDEAATIQALQNRLGRAGATVAVLLVLATAAMAVARYM